MRKSKGKMRRNTRKMRKHHRSKGMRPPSAYLREYEQGQKVCISIWSSEPKSMPKPKYQGRTGTVIGKQGRAYKVKVRDGNAYKELIVPPVHLNPA